MSDNHSGEVAEDIEDRDAEEISLQLAADYLIYRRRDRPVSLFFGAGPVLSIGRSESHRREEETDDGELTTINDISSSSREWRTGLHAVIGVEWRVATDIALIGEYGTSLSYSHETVESTRHSTYVPDGREDVTHSKDSGDGLFVTATAVSLGVSLFF